MDSMLSPPDISSDDRSLCLPAHCMTVAAEDLRVRLVLASDLDDSIEIEASGVASIGQAALQILVASRIEADRTGQPFSISNPSVAFLERVTSCRLAEAIGVETQKDDPS